MLLTKCHNLIKNVIKYLPHIHSGMDNIDREKIIKEKEGFVAALTHDLKGPINAEITALELLIKNQFGVISTSQKEILTNVLDSVRYMKHITDQILSFYKMNNKGIQLQKEQIYFEDIVEDSISFMKFLPEGKSQKIYINKELERQKINADAMELKRVINNLISNAVEYSPEYSNIYINLYENNANIIFKITDNGYGIDKKNLKNIFNEYISLAKTQKRVGFGLGLNICKKIIEAHNGSIHLESKLGKGTSITFTLPK